MEVASTGISNSLIAVFINILEPHRSAIGYAFKCISFSVSTCQYITNHEMDNVGY